MPRDAKYYCRVCGHRPERLPWGEDGRSPGYDFCTCCGVEHGIQDSSPAAARKFREAWIRAGAPWEDPGARPAGWSLEEHLRDVPADSR